MQRVLVLVVLWIAGFSTARAAPDDPDQRMARSLVTDARAGRETRVTIALADYGKGRASIRRERIVAVFTESLGRPTQRGTLLIWHARRTLTVERIPMPWGEGLRIIVE